MDSVALLQQVVDTTSGIVEGIEPTDLTKPTPCTEWTVRDLVNHITSGATIFAISAEKGEVPEDELGRLMGDVIGDDYKGAWKEASDRAMVVFGQPGVLEKIVTLPFGQMPAGIALNIAIFDVCTHAADLAKATGHTITDTALLETALEIGKQTVGPELRQPGVFGPERSAPAGAPAVDRLLAFAGREV